MALITGCLGVTAASFYEIYEWVVDHWFGQHLFIGETDTITDLADGFLGAAIGGCSWRSGRSPATPVGSSRTARARRPQGAFDRAPEAPGRLSNADHRLTSRWSIPW